MKQSVTATFKPRANQVKPQRYAIGTTAYAVSEELLSGSHWTADARSSFAFMANEVQVYSVLSVAQPGDAAWMLSRGVRSADAALEYLRAHGAEHRAVRRTAITADALRRGIPSHDFIFKMRLAIIAFPDDDTDPRVMDVMELSTISSLAEQWGRVAAEVKNGAIRLEDIKYLGVSKLKSFRRLESVKEALRTVHEPDAKFSMDDLKYVVDRAARDSLSEIHFRPLVDYLVAEGVEEIKKLDSLKLLRTVGAKHRYDEHRFQRITYELKFRGVYDRKSGVSYPEKELVELFDAGVPADQAASLMNEGVSVASVIGIAVGGIEKPLAEGWL